MGGVCHQGLDKANEQNLGATTILKKAGMKILVIRTLHLCADNLCQQLVNTKVFAHFTSFRQALARAI